MKRKTAIICVILSSSLFLSLNACSEKETENGSFEVATTRAGEAVEPSLSKYFEVTPKMRGWASFKTNVEKLKASQLSEEMLRNLSTEELIEACIDYPYACAYTAGANERDEISFYISTFNGLAELMKREDRMTVLANVYKSIPYTANGEIEGRAYNTSLALVLGYLELIMADASFSKGASPEVIKLMKDAAYEKLMCKLEHTEYFGLQCVKRSLMLCAEIVLLEGKAMGKDNLALLHDYVRNYAKYSEEQLEEVSRLIML